jgi:hypothetical protein
VPRTILIKPKNIECRVFERETSFASSTEVEESLDRENLSTNDLLSDPNVNMSAMAARMEMLQNEIEQLWLRVAATSTAETSSKVSMPRPHSFAKDLEQISNWRDAINGIDIDRPSTNSRAFGSITPVPRQQNSIKTPQATSKVLEDSAETPITGNSAIEETEIDHNDDIIMNHISPSVDKGKGKVRSIIALSYFVS